MRKDLGEASGETRKSFLSRPRIGVNIGDEIEALPEETFDGLAPGLIPLFAG